MMNCQFNVKKKNTYKKNIFTIVTRKTSSGSGQNVYQTPLQKCRSYTTVTLGSIIVFGEKVKVPYLPITLTIYAQLSLFCLFLWFGFLGTTLNRLSGFLTITKFALLLSQIDN